MCLHFSLPKRLRVFFREHGYEYLFPLPIVFTVFFFGDICAEQQDALLCVIITICSVKAPFTFATTYMEIFSGATEIFCCICRSTPARQAASPCQPKRHPNAQRKTQFLKLLIRLLTITPKLLLIIVHIYGYVSNTYP